MTAPTVGEAVVELRADVDRLRRDLTNAGDTAGQGFAGRFGKALAGLGALAGGAAVTGFLKDAVGGASDLNETISKTQVVFGPAADAVLRFSSQGAAALGQTQQQALDAASTFGVFGKSAGLTGRDLSGFSTEMTGLATDLASFHNTSPEEAIDALGAALRGESEPMRRYGVLLDDASLRQEAMRQGLIKTTSQALTPQQKVLAAHALIMKQTSLAQGDFQRTSGGLANQSRILGATFVDLRTKLGAQLLPIVLTVTKAIASFLGGIQDGTGAGGRFAEVASRIGDAVRGFVADFKSGTGAAGDFRRIIEGVAGAVAGFVRDFVAGEGAAGLLRSVLQGVAGAALAFTGAIAGNRAVVIGLAAAVTAGVIAWKTYQAAQAVSLFWLKLHTVGTVENTIVSRAAAAAARVWAAGQWVLNAAMSANPIGLVVAAIVLLVAAFVIAYKHSETFRRIITAVFQAVRGVVLSVIGWVRGFIVAAWAFIVSAVRGYLNAYRTVIVTVFQVVKNIVTNVSNAVKNVVSNAWKAINTAVRNAVNAVKTGVQNGFTAVRNAVSSAMTAAKTAVSNGWTAIKTAASSAIGKVVETVQSLPGKIRNIGASMLSAGKEIGGKIISGIMSGIKAAGGYVSELVSSIKGAINSALHLPFTIHGPGPLPDFSIPAFAQGVLAAPGGIARVGEHGPEDVYLPRGSRVLSNAESRRRESSGDRSLVQNIYLPTGDPQAAAAAVASRWVLAGLT